MFTLVIKPTTIRVVLSLVVIYKWIIKQDLYGLKQAPRAWFKRLQLFRIHLGFTCSKASSSLFILNVWDSSNAHLC